MKKVAPQKISLNVKESLEAKELLRQRYLPDGTVENLVRWRLYGPEKKSSVSEDSSSSASLNEDSKVGKDVLLWMTNHELMVCSPHLYNTETAVDQGNLVSDEGRKDEEATDGSSDVEDLDDMRLDVIKLVNRARKQMHRMKKESTMKPLVSLSHTTKVLSTYAGLGSLANVFRETGALDLILELLWTNDVDTRRAAGRMLRALALHDAGSRAYVLLSLTQDYHDEKSSDHKQHYADFENRSMVMEMFAETASGEEAHAVALDSVQLPQVPGKSLFTLMKCYLRVTSLMDSNNKGDNKRSQQKLLWMRLDSDKSSSSEALTDEFEVALAISDLIYELNNVMDWNSKSSKLTDVVTSDAKEGEKGLSPPPTPTLFGSRLKEMVKAIRKCKQVDVVKAAVSQNRCKPVPLPALVAKPLFLQTARESSVDPLLLSSLLRAGEPNSTTYRHPSSFSSRRQYAEYVRAEVRPGFRVRACQSYQDVNEGDEGIYRQYNHSTPPVQVFWHRLNRTYWVYWHHIVLLGEGSSTEEAEPKPPAKFALSPETSSLWPYLNGMQDKVKPLYGVQTLKHWNDASEKQDKKNEISLKEWWVVLFYTNRMPVERRNAIKDNLAEKYPDPPHMCCMKPTREDARMVMKEILKDCTDLEKENMCASSICRELIGQIEKEEQEGKEKSETTTSKENDVTAEDSLSATEKSALNLDASTSGAKVVKCDVAPEPEVSIEERAKAVEMGLRLGLIVDDETEKRYRDIFLDEENRALAEKLWKMCQDSRNLVKISKWIQKSGRGGKIIALCCMSHLVKSEDTDSFNKRKDLDDVFSNTHVAADDTDSCIVSAYLQFIWNCLQKQPVGPEDPEVQMKLTLSGHLKSIFDMIMKFKDQKPIVHLAILCTSAISQAHQFAKNPSFGKDSTFKGLISVIITSIFAPTEHASPTGESSSSNDRVVGTSVLHSYAEAVERLLKRETEDGELPLNNHKRNQLLYSALCVLCLVARKDQNKVLLKDEEFAMRMVETGLECTDVSTKVRLMLQRFKGLLVSLSSSDALEIEMTSEQLFSDKSVDNSSDDDLVLDDDIGSNEADVSASETLTGYISKLKSLPLEEIRPTTTIVMNELILPALKKISSVSSECVKCVASLKSFLHEFEGVAREHNLILFEPYWPSLVFVLQNILELCVSTTNKSLSLDIATEVIATLQTLSSLDKDFAVFLCGLEARQTISRLQEKHDSAPELIKMASDLCDVIGSCDRQRTLHNRLLAVVLGGCISTALNCIEEARRMRKPINIPLFDQLLSNLCKGADLELKEDKCYERLEVSSNPRQISRLTDGNNKSYWESNGSAGAHWVNIYMKKGIIVRKLSIVVAQEDSSYMPSRVVVFGGTSSSDVTTQLSCVNVGSTDREIVILENARRYWPVIRISIRRCQQGGIDTRIHGIEVVGPKPSFWPLLRRQLYIRTSLIYSVQVHSWVADANVAVELTLDQIMKHKILDVPSRLLKAIEFEQQFADEYLPNPESALVLGQACRSAFSNPILQDLLAKFSSNRKSLLELMLDAYVERNESGARDMTSVVFSSKLRRLLRLAVDLDQGAGGGRRSQSSGGSASLKGQQEEEHGIVAFGKRVQPFNKRWGAAESKLTRVDSSSSLGAALTSKQPAEDSSSGGEDLYEPLSYLPQISEQWITTVKHKLTAQLKDAVTNWDDAIGLDECLRVTTDVFNKYKSFQKWTEDLFGHKSLFSLTLAVGTWKSILALSYESKRKLCYAFNVIIHNYIVHQARNSATDVTSRLRIAYDQLRVFLSLAVGTNFCSIFEELYVNLLMTRIANCRDFCFDVEERVCKTFQCSFPTQQPINLVQDVRYSEKLNASFLSSYIERCDSLTSSDTSTRDEIDAMWAQYDRINLGAFKVAVFRPGACRKYVADTQLDLNSMANDSTALLMKEFEIFFELERSNQSARMFSAGNRALSWVGECGHGVLYDVENKIEITASVADCLFLLRFNYERDISSSNPALVKMVERKLIFESSPGVYKLCDHLDTDVDLLESDDNRLKALWQVSGTLEDSYNKCTAQVDCAIVRIMKHESQLSFDALIEKTIRSCSHPDSGAGGIFCSADVVRARIEHHLHMGYLIKKDNSHILIYNPDDELQKNGEKNPCPPEEDTPGCSTSLDVAKEENEFVHEFIKSVTTLSATALANEQKSKNNSTSTFLTTPADEEKKEGPSRTSILRPSGLSLGGVDRSGSHSFSFFTNMMSTTISCDLLLAEIRSIIDQIAQVLSQDIDDVEALLLVYEWNADKLIDSYVNDRVKTLHFIGVTLENVDASSTSQDAGDEPCPICMSAIVTSPLVTPHCRHVCCNDCWKAYLSTKLDQDGACATMCPMGACQSRITTKMYHSVFADDAERIRKYDTSLVRSFVESNRSYSWCHNPKGCDMIIRKSKDGRDEGWCDECGWQTCFMCTYVEAHYPATCSHMSQWMDDGGYYEGMNEEAQSKHLARLIAKRCPNCQANIEKNDGCLHMKCIKCSHDFCWRCLQPWRPTHRDYYNCSTKVSKLAQSNSKFVEFNKRCQHHNKAKSFAFSVRDRLLSLDSACSVIQLKFAMDLCTKLAHYRRILAYCNVFYFYSNDTDRLNNIGLHSQALEDKVLLLQEYMKDVLLRNADIEHMVSVISEDAMSRGCGMMTDCDAAVKIIIEFSKQGMKVATTAAGKDTLSSTDAGTIVFMTDEGSDALLMNARPAGMSDDDEMSEQAQSDNNRSDDSDDDDDGDDDDDDDVNMYSTDDDDDNDLHYDSGGGMLMDYDTEEDNMVHHRDSDDGFGLF